MTDLPGRLARGARRGAAAAPDDPAAHARGRQGHHPQDALEAVRRRAGRVGADALSRPRHDVRLLAGRLRHGLPVLRDRPGRPAAQHVDRRDRRAGRRRCPVAGARRGAGRSRPGLQRRVHGHGRADGQLQGRDRRRTPADRPGARRARHVRPRRSRSRPSGWCRGSTSWPTEGIPVTLALSLHAPDDELRNELVPINTRWKVDEAVEAAWNYARATKRRVSIEYAMMRDINDQAWRADLLGDVLTSYGDWGWVHVNLIPLNPTPGSKWTASAPGRRARVRAPAGGQGRADHGPRHPRPRDRRRLRPARRQRCLTPRPPDRRPVADGDVRAPTRRRWRRDGW